ncbi:hypothetical protein K440DRAFT_641798 [Wilcoxina mikolae CBS 423.85]|nr:hypothetical protein K440DRAFT_641798 [Wilcoxina mikolae CBS 423.85]
MKRDTVMRGSYFGTYILCGFLPWIIFKYQEMSAIHQCWLWMLHDSTERNVLNNIFEVTTLLLHSFQHGELLPDVAKRHITVVHCDVQGFENDQLVVGDAFKKLLPNRQDKYHGMQFQPPVLPTEPSAIPEDFLEEEELEVSSCDPHMPVPFATVAEDDSEIDDNDFEMILYQDEDN